MPENCPACNHPQHAAGTECTGGVSHGSKHFHLCLCLNRPGADRACPPLMQCMGGELGYADLYYLQQGRTVYGTGGKIYTPSLLRGDGSRHVGYRSWVSPHMLRCLGHAPEGSQSPFDWRRVTVSDVEASDLRRTCSYRGCGVDVLEASKVCPSCVCGEPAMPGTVHCADGPCYVDEQPETQTCPSREPLTEVQCAKEAGHEVHSDRPGRIWYPAPATDEATAEHHTVDGVRHLCHTGDHYCPDADGPIDRVRALHAPDENGECLGCGSSFDPCSTIAVIDGPSGVAEETHVVADDSDEPEHVDDCPGCEAFTLTGHIAEAQQPTPCSVPNPCDADTGELCGVHEVEQAHADGDHEYCGVTCEVEFPSEKLRNTILYRAIPGSGNMLKELLRRAGNRSALMEAHIALAEQAGKDQQRIRELEAELGIGPAWICPVCSKENHRRVCLICETDRPDPEDTP